MAEFVYYNADPEKNHNSDCVTRAISLAIGCPYSEVRKKLFYTAKLFKCERICLFCYKYLLEDIFKCLPVECEGMSVEEFADKHPIGVFLVRMNGHISTIIDNVCYDTFDCRKQNLTDAWLVEI